MEKFIEKHWKFVFWVVIVLYLFSHLVGLIKLPVFADEAIYIRWSQLMIEDFSRFALFPLNDGKTPLQMWLMIPFLKTFSDPLFAGRLMLVTVGLFQLLVISKIVERLKGGKIAQLLSMFLVTLLPFWYFHHRMALIDGLLTFWLSLVILGILNLVEQSKGLDLPKISKGVKINLVKWAVFSGIALGLAFLTKLPAMFMIPAMLPFSLINLDKKKKVISSLFFRLVLMGFVVLIGGLIFLTLKFHPAFGQLFSRGGDFTFSIQDILSGEWRTSLRTFVRLSGWLTQYLTLPLVLIGIISLFISKQKQKHWSLWASSLFFALPLIIFGKVLYPRYFMPTIIGVTISVALFFEEVVLRSTPKARWTLIVLLFGSLILPLQFILASLFSPNQIPFVSIDKEQYLTEWSAGNGISEIVELIEDKSKEGRIYVMTEGYFGTLPDGLLMHFFGKEVDSIEIEGIGQPVKKLPENFIQKTQTAKTIWLVVNSHRMELVDSRWQKIYSFARVGDAPSLDVYELSH